MMKSVRQTHSAFGLRFSFVIHQSVIRHFSMFRVARTRYTLFPWLS